MSFSIFFLFLILLHSSPTEQSTEKNVEVTTETTTENTTDTATDPTTTIIDRTTNSLSGNYNNTEIITITEPTTSNSSTNLWNTETIPLEETTIEDITKDSITDLTVSTTPIKLLENRFLSNDGPNSPENKKSNEQNLQSDKTNVSKVNVFGIVLASIVGSVAVFYIIVSLIKNHKRASYVVRSPNMELGEA